MRYLFGCIYCLFCFAVGSAAASGYSALEDPSLLQEANGGDGSQGVAFKNGEALAVDPLLDVTGDGIPDVGVRDISDGTYRLYVLAGNAGTWPADLTVGDAQIQLVSDLVSPGASDPFIRDRIEASGGDYDGNGLGNFIVSQRRSCYPFCASNAPIMSFMDGLDYTGGFANDNWPLEFIQDITGDGRAEIMVNSRYDEDGQAAYTDPALRTFGIGTVPLLAPSGHLYFCDYTGGDINGDGYGDVGMGDYGYRFPFGSTYKVMFGSPDLAVAASVEYDELGTPGHPQAIEFIHTGKDVCRMRLNGNGDFNGDGKDDVLITWSTSASLGLSSGYILFGADFPNNTTIDINSLNPEFGGDGSAGLALRGPRFYHLNYVGDINDDGFDDVAVTYLDDAGQAGAIIFGRADTPSASVEITDLHPDNGGDGSEGFLFANEQGAIDIRFAASVGDMNQDGIDDISIVTPGTGHAYVLFGRSMLPDQDNDGVGDSLDNCLLASNPLQMDTDADGFGNACDADFNNDCVVNFQDLSEFAAAFNSSEAEYDLDNSGTVNFLDLSRVTALFFQAPGPSALDSLCRLAP